MLRAFRTTYQDLSAGRYLTDLRRLQREYISWEATPLAANFLLWALNAIDPWDSAWKLSGSGEGWPERAADLIDPEEAVAEALQSHRVVILMEAHRAPETRFFGARLLGALKAGGATHLAFETAFQGPLDRFARTGVVRPDTEVYAFEPSRAYLLRAARAAGLKLVAFDFPPQGYLRPALGRLLRGKRPDPETMNRDRERHMAENIARLIFQQDARARVVVWTGEQHAMKQAPPDWIWQHPFMAAHLGRLMGEEPYCVWQKCVHFPSLDSGPRLLRGDHPALRQYGVDAMVLHHRGNSPARPAWLDAQAVPVEIQADGAELIQAIPAAEGDSAVPAAQWLAREGSLHVRLERGDYLLRGLGEGDSRVWQSRLHAH